MEQISQLAYELSQSPQKGTSLEEASLLKAYLELAKIIMDRNGVHVRGEGTSGAPIRVTHARIDGPSPLQNPALRLRQP